MSRQRISRNPDLARLREEGYDVQIVDAYIFVKDVPYLDPAGAVQYGMLAATFSEGDRITQQGHTALFVGGLPHESDGQEMSRLFADKNAHQISGGLTACCTCSQKPTVGGVKQDYPDFYEKFTSYIRLIAGPAMARGAKDPRTFPAIPEDNPEGPFEYADTASSRADIVSLSAKLLSLRVAIVGLGGSGSYVLDLLAKSAVQSIIIFDGDHFLSHSAFRAPGATSIEDLNRGEFKVEYYARKYSVMRRRIEARPVHIDSTTVDELQGVHYAFVCVDDPEAKAMLFDKLEEFGVPFVDVGMGLYKTNDQIGGLLRVTSSTPDVRASVRKHVNVDGRTNDEYSRGIQIVELNALCAALAVVRFKKDVEFYGDTEGERHSVYMINGNSLVNEELRCPDSDN
jgi:hypothetical protein